MTFMVAFLSFQLGSRFRFLCHRLIIRCYCIMYDSVLHPILKKIVFPPINSDLSVFGDLEIPDEVPQISTSVKQQALVTPSESPSPGANPPNGGFTMKEPESSFQYKNSSSQSNMSLSGRDGNATGSRNGVGAMQSIERNFDHLFDDADSGTEEQLFGAKVDIEKDGEDVNVDTQQTRDTMSKPVDASPLEENATNNVGPAEAKTRVAANARTKENSTTVLPLAPIITGKVKSKKPRFKAKPQISKKAVHVNK